jgi:hypothetical protein
MARDPLVLASFHQLRGDHLAIAGTCRFFRSRYTDSEQRYFVLLGQYPTENNLGISRTAGVN